MKRPIDKKLLRHFGIEQLQYYFSKTSKQFCDDIEDGFLNHQMNAVVGAVGAGKSELFEMAKNNQRDTCKFVYISNLYKEKLTIASVINAIIYNISDENPKRDLEARTIQLTRLLGEYKRNHNKTVVVVLEEAHRPHMDIFRAFKELREMTYNKRANLFSVVFIGHPRLLSNLSARKEARWRCNVVELNESSGWMKQTERKNFVLKVFGQAVTKDAAVTISKITKTPLEIVFYLENKMKEARKAGKKVIDGDVVKPTNAELKTAYDLSVREIAKEANISSTSVHAALKDEDNKFSPDVKAAINRLGSKINSKAV